MSSNRLVPFPGTFDQREERTVMVPVARLALRATAGPLRGQQFTFDGGTFVIGRAQTCTVAIPSQAVSRAHARIEYGNGGYWIIPEKTVNGTRVNGSLVQEPTQLADNDKIAIDDSAFVVACRAPGDDLDFEDLAPPPAAGSVRDPGPQGRNSVTAMSAPAPRYSAQLSGQIEPVRESAPVVPQTIQVEPQYRYSTPEFQHQLPVRPSFAQMPYDPSYAPYPYPHPPPPVAANRTGLWILAGIGMLALISGVVVVTIKLVGPPVAAVTPPVVPVPAPVVVAPVPAPPPAPVIAAGSGSAAPAPAPAPPPPPPAPAPAIHAALTIETTQVLATARGTVVDVARVGTAVKSASGVARVRLYTANFDAAQAKLASLEKKYGTSEDYADFIAQAKQDYAAAARRREVKAIGGDATGTIRTIKVKPGDELRIDQVVAELAVARITVPADAIEGSGKTCVANVGKKKLKGTLLAVGSAERTFELDQVPKDLTPGDIDATLSCE